MCLRVCVSISICFSCVFFFDYVFFLFICFALSGLFIFVLSYIFSSFRCLLIFHEMKHERIWFGRMERWGGSGRNLKENYLVYIRSSREPTGDPEILISQAKILSSWGRLSFHSSYMANGKSKLLNPIKIISKKQSDRWLANTTHLRLPFLIFI